LFFWAQKLLFGDFGAFFHKGPVCESHWVFFYRQVMIILPQKGEKKNAVSNKIKIKI
jgi:hypothetical protein